MNAVIQSEHFTLHLVTEGVYAAIATEGGAGFSNAGIINLGDQTLVFDAFENPQAAEDLLRACLQLTNRKPEVVIISHFHHDHWGGLQVFKGSMILATPATRQKMIPEVEQLLLEKQDPSGIEKELQETEARLVDETNPNKRLAIQSYISRLRHELKSLPKLEPTLPNQTFTERISFYGSQRLAELIATGKGHTVSDCTLILPDDRVAFIGDIGFFQSQPFMPYGFPSKWLTLLDKLIGRDIETFVPGHGPLGSKDDLALQAKYIRTLEELVMQTVQAGGTVQDALSQTLPVPFDRWQVIGSRFEANVSALFERYHRASKSK